MLDKLWRQLTEGKTLIQFSFIKGLGQSLEMIAPLVIAKIFAEDLYGSYTLSKMVIFFFVTMLATTPQVPFIVHAGQERTETGRINKSFSVQVVFLLASIIIFVFCSMALMRPIGSFAEISGPDVAYMSIAFVGISVRTFLCNLFLALGRRITNSLAELTYGALTLALITGSAAMGTLSIKAVFMVYFISAAITLLIFIRAIDWKLLLPFSFSISHFRGMFDFTKWILFGATATFLVDWGDNAILKAFSATLADIGQYALAYQIFNGVVTLIYTLNSYFLPFISENIKDSSKMRDYLYSKRPRILLLGLIILAAAFFACPYAFQVVYKDTFQSSVNVLRILLIGSSLVLYNTFYLPLVNAMKLYKFSQTVNIIHMIMKILLSIILVPFYGFYGAVCGTIVSYLCVTIIYESYYRVKIRKLLMI